MYLPYFITDNCIQIFPDIKNNSFSCIFVKYRGGGSGRGGSILFSASLLFHFFYFYLSRTIPFFKRDHQMQFDNMFEEALINKEWLIGVLPLFHITVHFQVKTTAYIFKDAVCMNGLLLCSNIFSQSSSFSFLSLQLL